MFLVFPRENVATTGGKKKFNQKKKVRRLKGRK